MRGDRARETLERVVALAREFGDSWWASTNLHSLAELALEDGEIETAHELSREAATLSIELDDRRNLVYCVGILACIAAARAEPEVAGRFWGALEALEQDGHAMPLRYRDRYAALVGSAEGAEFAVAAEAARQIPTDEVVELVRDSLD